MILYREMNKERLKQQRRDYYLRYRESAIQDRKNWYSNNRELAIKKSIEYQHANKEKVKKKSAEWRENNRERMNQLHAEYLKNNPDIASMHNSRRRARKAGNGGSHTVDQRREKFLQLGNVCYYCGIPGKMTVDHMTPISRYGTDNIDNIVPACSLCNQRKKDKTAEEFFEIINTPKEIAFNQARVAEYKLTH